MLAQEARPTTASRWPMYVAGAVVLWLVAVLWTLSRPFTDHVPVAAVPPPRTTMPFVYRCEAPLLGSGAELVSGPAPGDATPSRTGCAAPRRTARALAVIDVVLTLATVGAMATIVVRRRSTRA